MKTFLDKLYAFQTSMGQGAKPFPDMVYLKKGSLRFRLMEEENKEYLEAVQLGDLVEVADALGDMLYILLGTIHEHGMQDVIEPVFNEIHRSNMSKLGEDGKPIFREDGKILKPEGYSKPNLKPIIDDCLRNYWFGCEHGSEEEERIDVIRAVIERGVHLSPASNE